MPLGARVVFFGLTGVVAGMIAWPFSEVLIYYQAGFPSLMVYNAAVGMTVGLLMGAVFGTSEGIIGSSGAKARGGALAGLAIGIAGGFAGFLSGQAAMLSLGSAFFNSTGHLQRYGVPLARAAGWAVFGIFVGIVEGIRSLAPQKIRNGIVGGAIGGFCGGLAVELLRAYASGSVFSRLVGLAVLGLLIGVFYGLIEVRLTRASLLLLNGRLRGREFPILQGYTRVGGSDRTEVALGGYRGVSDIHAEIRREKGEYVLTDPGTRGGVYVNDEKVKRTVIHEGDVIRVGGATLQFRKR